MKTRYIFFAWLLMAPLVFFAQAAKEPAPTDFVEVEQEATPLNMQEVKTKIVYPAIAKEAALEGKVVVRVLVDERGNYAKHVVIKDPHALLTNEVVSKVNLLKFTPAVSKGKPVKMWVTIPFDFRLPRESQPAGR
jgi:periplasmic protein TonB